MQPVEVVQELRHGRQVKPHGLGDLADQRVSTHEPGELNVPHDPRSRARRSCRAATPELSRRRLLAAPSQELDTLRDHHDAPSIAAIRRGPLSEALAHN